VPGIEELAHVPHVADALLEAITTRLHETGQWGPDDAAWLRQQAQDRNGGAGWTYSIVVVVEGRDEQRTARDVPEDLLALAIQLAEVRAGLRAEGVLEPGSERGAGQ